MRSFCAQQTLLFGNMGETGGSSMTRMGVFDLPFKNPTLSNLEFRLNGVSDIDGEIDLQKMAQQLRGSLDLRGLSLIESDLVTPCMTFLFGLQMACLTFRTWRYQKYYGQRQNTFRILVHAVGIMDMVFGIILFVGYLSHMDVLNSTWSAEDVVDECGQVFVNPIYVSDLLTFPTVLLWAGMCSLIRRMTISVIFNPKEDPILAGRRLICVTIGANLVLIILQALINHIAVPLDDRVWYVAYFSEKDMANSFNNVFACMIFYVVILIIWTRRSSRVSSIGRDADIQSLNCAACVYCNAGNNIYPEVCYCDNNKNPIALKDTPSCYQSTTSPPDVNSELSVTSFPSTDAEKHKESQSYTKNTYLGISSVIVMFGLSRSWMSPLSFHAMSLMKYVVMMSVISTRMLSSDLIFYLARDKRNLRETIADV